MSTTIKEAAFAEALLEQHEQRQAQKKALALLPDTAVQLHQDVEQMGALLVRMGQVIGAMQRRMDEMEARQAAVTVRHADVKRIQARIRSRAEELCGKYNLTDPESQKKFRAAMKKDILKRWGVRDLHDLPDAALPAVEKALGSWTNIRLIMERRAGA